MIEAIAKLKQLEGANFSEVCAKHVFECYRQRSDGCMQEVTVVVLDGGPTAAPNARYYCHAQSEEGRQVSSTPQATLDSALASIRWADLDPDPPQDARPDSAADAAPHSAPAQHRRELFDRFRQRLTGKSGSTR